jgi:hypothetical protein
MRQRGSCSEKLSIEQIHLGQSDYSHITTARNKMMISDTKLQNMSTFTERGDFMQCLRKRT